MNECIFLGRLANEPQKQVIKKGETTTTVVNFKLAVDREYWGGKNNKDFLPFAAYGKMGDIIYNNFTIGSKILIKCVAQADSKNYYTVLFNVSRIYYIENKQVINHDGEEFEEIVLKQHFDRLEEVEETPPTSTGDEKPKKRSKKG